MQKIPTDSKLVYVSPSAIPSLTANSVHVLMQIEAFRNMSYDVSLFFRTNHFFADLPKIIKNRYSVHLHSHEIKPLYYPFERGSTLAIAIYALSKLIWRNGKLPLISRNLYFSFIWTVLLRRKAIFETHQVEAKLGSFMQRLVLNNKRTHTVVISEKLKQILEEKYCLRIPHCTILHDAASDINNKIGSLSSEICNFVNKFKFENNFFEVAGYFGHLYAGRGVEIILGLASRNSGTLFLICGGNPSQVDFLKRHNSLPNLLILGHQSYLDARQLMCECDILLMPYQRRVSIGPISSDTSKWMSPMKMFEYMSTGKPIIASNLEVLREVLVDSVNALLVEPDCLDDWHSALSRLRSDRHLARQIGGNARRDVLSGRTWTHRAERIAQILEWL